MAERFPCRRTTNGRVVGTKRHIVGINGGRGTDACTTRIGVAADMKHDRRVSKHGPLGRKALYRVAAQTTSAQLRHSADINFAECSRRIILGTEGHDGKRRPRHSAQKSHTAMRRATCAPTDGPHGAYVCRVSLTDHTRHRLAREEFEPSRSFCRAFFQPKFARESFSNLPPFSSSLPSAAAGGTRHSFGAKKLEARILVVMYMSEFVYTVLKLHNMAFDFY